MAGESLTIRELTGSGRTIELLDRAMPYRPAAWPRTHRFKKTTYSGNPRATIQMLGTDDMGLELNGFWKARYVAAAAEMEGFEDLWSEGRVITPETLIAVFDRILRGGNLLEVTWANEVRRGVMTEFEPSYDRVEDVSWSCRFEWTQANEFEAPRAADIQDTQNEIDTALSDLEDSMSQIPPIILPNITSAILLQETVARESGLAMSVAIAAIYGVPEVSSSQFQRVSSNASSAAAAALALRALLADTNIEDMVATDDVNSLLAAQAWSTLFASRSLGFAAVAIRAREATRGRVVADLLGIVRLGRNQTLRTLALEYYGSADDWTYIADANGFTTSVPGVGAVVKIPRRRNVGA